MLNLLIVDDELSFRKHLSNLFEKLGYNIKEAGNGEEASSLLNQSNFDVVLLDLVLPDVNGVEILKNIKDYHPQTQVIIMTANATVETAISSMKLGAYDYLVKPFDFDELEILIQRAIELISLQQQNEVIKREKKIKSRFDNFVGTGQHSKDILEQVEKVAPTSATVLITGETGTGKEIIARAIHQKSHRREKPFIVINCGAIQDTLLESEMFGHEKGAFTGADKYKRGLIEVANKGTLFLDEIGEVSPEFQKTFLRFLESGEYRPVGSTYTRRSDVRVVAATNRDLKLLMKESKFREDLFYRLNVFNIQLKPLRERIEDLEELVEYCLQKICYHVGKCLKGVTPEALDMLKNYNWPGNVRELENVLERAVILSINDLLSIDDLPSDLRKEEDEVEKNPGLSLASLEKQHIIKMLEKNKGNKTQTARDLGITKKTLYHKMHVYNIPL